MVEDRALGKLAKERGLKIALKFSPDDVSAEWAPGFKNGISALQRVSVPPMRERAGVGAAFSFALSVLLLMPLLSVLLGAWTVPADPGIGAPVLLLGVATLAIELIFTLISAARIRVTPIPFALGFVPASLVWVVVLWRNVFNAWLAKPMQWRKREYRF